MFRAMLWKEVREQAAILIALLVLGSGVIAAAAVLGSTTGLDAGVADFRAYTNAGRLAVLSLAVAAGVVIGGTLFAGEKENETLGVLEQLPATRLKVWWAKLAAGVVMATAAGVTLLAMGTFIGALGSTSLTVWLMWGLVLVFVAFGWGTFGSTITESTLGACAVGLVCAVIMGTPTFAVAAVLLRQIFRVRQQLVSGIWLELPALLAMYAVALLPLLLAGLIFTAPDRARQAVRRDVSAPRALVRRINSPGLLGSLRALLWLTNRQWVVAALVGVGLALLTGVVGLHEDVHLMLVWPLATALAGVLGGVLAWADEQRKDTFRFWGERRLPLGRLWMMKVATSFAQTLGWALLIFAPSLVRQLVSDHRVPLVPGALRSGVLGEEQSALVYYLLVWPLYGFAFGHLAGLLFRKTIVAVGVGLLAAAPVASLWLPSLLTGGVHHWQLWPVPLLVLLATRLLLRPWSADRLATLRPLGTLAVVGAACVAWVAYGLFYRFHEVPVVAEIDDDLAFAQTVPQLDGDDGGRAFRQVTSGFRLVFREGYVRSPDGRALRLTDGDRPTRDQLQYLATDRWPEDALKAYGGWLADPGLEGVVAGLKEAAAKPHGPIENPRGLTVFQGLYRDADEVVPAVGVLLARGLWKQLAGDHDEFPACLDAALAVTRNARTMQPRQIWHYGLVAERQCFDAADAWVARVGNRPDAVRQLLAVLRKHDAACPRDAYQAFLTERMIDRNVLVEVSQWGPRALEYQLGSLWGRYDLPAVKQKAEVETELFSFSLAVPWERERYRRLLGLNNAPGNAVRIDEYMNRWFARHLTRGGIPKFAMSDLVSETLTRLAVTQAALKLFEAEQQRAAKSLDELVPHYLPAVPVDPCDGKPLRYRISDGERIKMGVKVNDIPQFPEVVLLIPVGPEERAGLSGAVGGFAHTDRQFGPAPGIGPDNSLEIDLDAVAAVAGGLVQWPLAPLEELGEEPGVTPAGRAAPGFRHVYVAGPEAETVIWQEVEAGDGIVWSVGPDLIDNEGRRHGGLNNGSREQGDLLRVVPKTKK
jgi:hypothetical protein